MSPLPVEQVRAGQLGAAEAVDGLTVQMLGGLALAEQGGQAGLPLDDGLRLVNVCHLPMVS